MCTVWEIQDFSVTQNLREINFGECKRLKMSFSNFRNSEFQPSENTKIHEKSKLRASRKCQNGSFLSFWNYEDVTKRLAVKGTGSLKAVS